MRTCLLLFSAGALTLNAAPKIDNVLLRMVPPGPTSLIGGRMDQIKNTDLYKKLVAARKLPQVDQFAEESGFDPRRDVRELLYATVPSGGVLLARGTFHVNEALLLKGGVKKIPHGQYTIWGQSATEGASGFCILDSTLAAAGEVAAIEAALDEWKSGTHSAAQPLLARAKSIDEQSPIWGVSTGVANFLADNVPRTSSGIDFSKIFRGLDNTWFEADPSRGLHAEIHGTTAREQDAVNVRDAVRGLVGLGRLSVPQGQPDLLRLWDGITVEQTGRSILIRADIEQNLIDKLVEMLGRGTSQRIVENRPAPWVVVR
jgi:hypothetical protein